MQPTTAYTEALRAEAIAIVQSMKTKQELEYALFMLENLSAQEVIGYEADGKPITDHTLIEDHVSALLELQNDRFIPDEEIGQWIESLPEA